MVGTWIPPCLSGRGRVGWGDRGGFTTHTHREPGLLGDRTSGFNGLRTSGPLGCTQQGEQGNGQGERPLPQTASLIGLLFFHQCLSALHQGIRQRPPGHLRGRGESVKAAQAPESSRQCPWGKLPVQHMKGTPEAQRGPEALQTPGQSQRPRPRTCRLSFCPFDLG